MRLRRSVRQSVAVMSADPLVVRQSGEVALHLLPRPRHAGRVRGAEGDRQPVRRGEDPGFGWQRAGLAGQRLGLAEIGDVACALPFGGIDAAIDLDGVFLGCKHAIRLIRETTRAEGSRGSILNISSIAGIIASGRMAAYNSAKAGVRHLTKSVALHCASKKDAITCNSIHPTFMDTPILDNFQGAGLTKEDVKAKLGRQVPLGVIGEPDDVAWGAVYLCSDEARFVTGAELYIDGGISAM